ncbi:MAG: FkbM family methyltransferase [Sphingorhabdus sp.]
MKSLERISQHIFLPELVGADSLTIDLGGNRGEFSTLIKSRYGWNVVAVEPTPDLAKHLRGLGLNVIEAAITGIDGKTSFTFDSAKELSGSVLGIEIVGALLNDESARQIIEVPSMAFSTLLKSQGKRVDLVKVDIEGAELDMFEQASDEDLLSVRQFTVEFHDYWYPELSNRTKKVSNRLTSLGFWMLRSGPNNKDVLFVHPDFRPSLIKRAYIGLWLRNIYGLGRAIRVAWCRLLR